MAETFEVLWSAAAGRDVDQILEYLAAEAGAERALELYERLRRSVETLAWYPRRCRVVPELQELGVTDFRELIEPPYRIPFRIFEKRLVIVGVLDSRRDLGELLIERSLGVP